MYALLLQNVQMNAGDAGLPIRDSCFLSLFFYYYFAGIFVCVLSYYRMRR